MARFIFFLLWSAAYALSSWAATATSVSQYGITWTFSQAREVGQFANGDWWVQGPVTITSITPAFAGGRNGWDVNPTSSINVAYDSRLSGYSAALVPALPYTATANSSIVKAVSAAEGVTSVYLQTAAVLTVLGQVPANNGAGFFRPPYFGTQKPLYSIDSLHLDLLPNLPALPTAPGFTWVATQYQRVQLDHKSEWTGRDMHPRDNMPDYGSSIGSNSGDAVLQLMLSGTQAEKMPGLINYVQCGIDLYHMVKGGCKFVCSGGGHGNGRKLPIVFAAHILNNQTMKTDVINVAYPTFGEDNQVFYSAKADNGNGKALWGQDCGENMYWVALSSSGGTGARDCRDPYGYIDGGAEEGGSYQVCCTSMTWKSAALALRLVYEMRRVWNYDPFLEYVDRYVNFGRWYLPDPCTRTQPSTFNGNCVTGTPSRFPTSHGANKDNGSYVSTFANAMWTTYRGIDIHPPKPVTNLAAAPVTDHEVTLTWTAAAKSEDDDYAIYYVIKRDNVQVGTSNSTSFTDKYLTAATAYTYTVQSVDDAGNISSAAAVQATTAADNSGPRIETAFTADLTTVVVVFNEALNKTSAETAGQYTVPGVTVQSARLEADDHIVLLTTTAHTASQNYTLAVSTIQDQAGHGAASQQKTYTAQDGFADDFEAGNTLKWTPSASANWEVLDDAGDQSLHCKTTSAERLLTPVSFGTFTFTCQVKNTETSVYRNNCLVFGYQDTSNYSYAMFAGASSATYNGIFKVVNNITTKAAGTGSAALLTETASYHAVKLTVDQPSGTINAWYDNNLVFTLVDNTYAAGKVGVWCKTKTGHFDNVLVQRYIQTPVGMRRAPAPGAYAPVRPFAVAQNPTSGTVTFVLDAEQERAPNSLEVRTLSGNPVRTLSVRPHQFLVVWDGRDQAGRTLASGMYLVKYGEWMVKAALVK